ncbi:unnamed protein product [Protopolystoma xenopodis]|uniref:Uncharacterized protein n=1 Tax=Protopolystoma xenopodis TaxID=117903 RepID=A0A3S5FH97_9PLAT|nr:unnamed protein product [Protopolystoma xenopodis]
MGPINSRRAEDMQRSVRHAQLASWPLPPWIIRPFWLYMRFWLHLPFGVMRDRWTRSHDLANESRLKLMASVCLKTLSGSELLISPASLLVRMQKVLVTR